MPTIPPPLTVLLIDDERNIRDIRCLVFELEGMVAISAADGNEGMSKAIVHSPDLIITDFMMPGIDGLEVCWRVRADERLQNVLLLWSAVRGIDAGGLADVVVEKLVQVDVLLRHVYALVRNTDRE
jgi:DNA-binding response OmpR family regulator